MNNELISLDFVKTNSEFVERLHQWGIVGIKKLPDYENMERVKEIFKIEGSCKICYTVYLLNVKNQSMLFVNSCSKYNCFSA